jgi:hypothetical protein
LAKKSADLKGIHRILDANLNRAAEGLRVCEEISRFILNDRALSRSLKDIRHKVNRKLKTLLSAGASLIEARDSRADVGKAIRGLELERKNVEEIFFANIQRVKESVRVLEEFSKLLDIKRALDFKEIRYQVYGIEKNVTEKMRALRHSR